MSKFALVVIDLQEDFLPSHGALAVGDGRKIIEPISLLLNTNKFPWKSIVATQDWHPNNHCSFSSQHNVEPFTELEFEHPLGEKDQDGTVRTMTQVTWPDHCIQDSIGASIDPHFLGLFNQIDPLIPSAVVRKGYLQDREYYSCFTDCWKLHKTEIEDFFKKNGITHVIFTGLAYDFCVLNSALDCAEAGFKTYVVKDCSKSVYPDKETDTDKQYVEGGVDIIKYDDIEKLTASSDSLK